ncbi:hypothetical protein H012_gp665 [Acanthamoeba polyphaga moumouvirus]|uniref:Uncharacterized protein n=1 Tax=Acanthamoeba polyphaga moumouvirus TaxID=1269028 RepID=L7RFW6_9VIRU|nr:hypothetical protein H012_gp665 [Acanthamoeba polyphaga moumouvirus]AGC01800.1 hypothetical protein Moumou_00256 [Acanthamoeba polyphaga moumouvirus]AQN68149.1 hypothetical protein [Saudi moumouvirus]
MSNLYNKLNILIRIKMSNKTLSPKKFIEQFFVTKCVDMNCKYLSFLLYSQILSNYKIQLSLEESQILLEYQNRIHNLLRNLREQDSQYILKLFEYLSEIEFNYLIDVIIMWWCLPESNSCFGKKRFNQLYKQCIDKYNHKLINLIECDSMKNFCVEVLARTNTVPVHCIDYLWYYMTNITLEPEFFNSNNSTRITFIIQEGNDESVNFIFGFNMEYMLYLGLGKVNYTIGPNKKYPFVVFLKKFITDLVIVNKLLESKTASNYKSQVINMSKNLKEYFGEYLDSIPNEILDRIKNA